MLKWLLINYCLDIKRTSNKKKNKLKYCNKINKSYDLRENFIDLLLKKGDFISVVNIRRKTVMIFINFNKCFVEPFILLHIFMFLNAMT